MKEICEVYGKSYDVTDADYNFYTKYIQISEEDIIQVACKTIEQSNCKEWFDQRRMRISLSINVHNIKSGKQRPLSLS